MKKIFFTAIFMASLFKLTAQDEDRVITTAVPFLTIAADARSAGMGDAGVSTDMDVFAQQWNAAKYAFSQDKSGFGMSYTPYLESVVNDIALLEATYYNKINDRSAFGGSLRYFGLGEIELRQTPAEQARLVKPNEFALDMSYSLKLSEVFSMSVVGRFINSNLKFQDDPNVDATAASSFAVDVGGYFYGKEKAYNSFDGRWKGGFNISNLGGKMKYDENGQENFLPTNLGLGGGFEFIFDQDNSLSLNVEMNKLLVPTPQDFDGDGDIDAEDNAEYQDIGFLEGVFKSFGDAPDGFKEEMQEIAWAFGAEYTFMEDFMFRGGYFYENPNKGARQFFSLGAGFRWKMAQIDLSYLFSTSNVKNPLENTLRFSLTFNFGQGFYY